MYYWQYSCGEWTLIQDSAGAAVPGKCPPSAGARGVVASVVR